MKSRIQSTRKTITAGSLLAVVVLWVLVVVSALAVVASTQQVRKQTDEIETLRRQASQLQVQWGQFLLERSTWAAYSRVEQVAISELNMKAPVSTEIIMIRRASDSIDEAPQ